MSSESGMALTHQTDSGSRMTGTFDKIRYVVCSEVAFQFLTSWRGLSAWGIAPFGMGLVFSGRDKATPTKLSYFENPGTSLRNNTL